MEKYINTEVTELIGIYVMGIDVTQELEVRRRDVTTAGT